MTLHKVQGMTLSGAFIHVSDCLNAHLFYTAITRVKSLEDLWFLQQLPPSLLLCTHFSPAVHKEMQRLIDLESLTTNSYLLKKAKQLSVDISHLHLIEMNVEQQDDKEEEEEEEEEEEQLEDIVLLKVNVLSPETLQEDNIFLSDCPLFFKHLAINLVDTFELKDHKLSPYQVCLIKRAKCIQLLTRDRQLKLPTMLKRQLALYRKRVTGND